MNDNNENSETFELSGDWVITFVKVLLLLLAGGILIAYLTYLSIVR